MKNLSLDNDNELFKEYFKTGDLEIRDIIFKKYEKLVYFLCSKLGEGYVDEDMSQEGHIALLKCIDGFNINNGASFKTYAYNRVLRVLKNFKIQNINYNGKFSRRKSIQLSIFNKREELENLGEVSKEDMMNEDEIIEFNKLKNFAFPINMDKIKEKKDGSGEYIKDILIDDDEYEIDKFIFEEDLLKVLNKKQLKLVELIKEGVGMDHIQKVLGIKRRAIFYIIKTIKEKIKKYSYEQN